MLPIRNLEQDAQIQIGDILVLNPFVAEIKTGNFYDYRSGFQLQYVEPFFISSSSELMT